LFFLLTIKNYSRDPKVEEASKKELEEEDEGEFDDDDEKEEQDEA